MNKIILAIAALSPILATSAANAGTPLVDARQNAQAHGFYRGVVNGKLTFNEAKRIARGQARVRVMERAAKSDGVVTLGERVRLNTALTVERARIYRLKHN
jgi:hypothetical protein